MAGDEAYLLWIGSAVMLCAPAYFALQGWVAYAWSGRWRTAALLPLLVMAPAVLHALFALASGSNLWPIVILLLAPLAFGYLLVVCAAHAIAGGARFT